MDEHQNMNSIYLHKEDLASITKFLESFTDRDTVLVTCDNDSGIGSIIKAHVVGATVNGNIVTVVKDIVDETSW